jgi:acyl-CoA synthetase (AMP-forming)/AMP-acid ligase II
MALDVSWPTQRLQTVLQHAQPDILVHNSSTVPTAEAAASMHSSAGMKQLVLMPVEQLLPDWQAAAAAAAAEQQAQQLPCSATDDGTRAATSSIQQQQQRQKAGCVQNTIPTLPWFYVLFTSGSTGSPLGVMGTEQGFINRFSWMQQQQRQQQQQQQQQQQTVPLQPGHVVAFKTAVGFVDHVWELLAPLLAGADMLLLPDAAAAAGVSSPSADGSLAAAQQRQGLPSLPQASLLLQPEALVQLLVQLKVTHLVRCSLHTTAAAPRLLSLALSMLHAASLSALSTVPP